MLSTKNLSKVVTAKRFNMAVAGVITANAVTIGLGTFPGFRDSQLLDNLNRVFYAFFVAELLLRVAAYGSRPWKFFRNGWNVFDLIVVASALMPAFSHSVQVLRLVRVARIVRIIRVIPDARILINSVVKSMMPLGSIVALTGMLLFVYGMVGWTLFGEELPNTWGNVGRSMLTLFVLLTLENFPTYLDEASAVSPWAVPFFLSYVMLGAFILFNLLIGIIINSLEEAREQEVRRGLGATIASVVDQVDAIRKILDGLESDLKESKALDPDRYTTVVEMKTTKTWHVSPRKRRKHHTDDDHQCGEEVAAEFTH